MIPMEKAIQQIKNLIKHNEHELQTMIDFFNGPVFEKNTTDSKDYVVEQATKIYTDLNNELQQAITILERNESMLVYDNENKTRGAGGWLLDYNYLVDISKQVEKEHVGVDLETIEIILLIANGEKHLI